MAPSRLRPSLVSGGMSRSSQPQLVNMRQRYFWLSFVAIASAIPTGAAGLTVGACASLLIAAHISLSRQPATWTQRLWSRRVWLATLASAVAVASSGFLNADAAVPFYSLAQLLTIALMVLVLSGLTNSSYEAVNYLALASTAQCAYFLLVRPDLTANSFAALWKYGLAFPATCAVLWLVCRYGRAAALAVLVCIGILSFSLNFRSFGLICLIAAVLIVAAAWVGHNRRKFVWVGLCACLAVGFVAPAVLESGLVGEEVKQKTISQSDSGPALLGGRTEAPLSVGAISLRPLFGWGNEQSLDRTALSRGLSIAESLGMEERSRYLALWRSPKGEVSLHSLAGSSWVQGGALGALWALVAVLAACTAIACTRGRLAPLVYVVSVRTIWDVLFSPWAQFRGESVAASLVLMAWVISEYRARHRRH